MRFLVDASLPRSAVHSLKQMGHDAVDVRDIGMRSATDDVIAAQVRMNRQALVTRDFDFADIRNYPPADYFGIVVLQLPEAISGLTSPRASGPQQKTLARSGCKLLGHRPHTM